MIGVSIDNQKATAAYAEAFRRLARMTGFDHKAVLRAEAGVILKTWAGRTKVSTQEKADRRSRLHAIRSLGYTKATDRGDVTVNAGFRPAPFGRVWIKVRNGGGRKNFLLAKGPNFSEPTGRAVFKGSGKGHASSTTQKWVANVNDAVADVNFKLPESIRKGRQATALSRQSVIQIADALGIDLNTVKGGGTLSAAGIAKARAALATTGRFWRNGTGVQGGNGISAYVDLINTLPYGTKIQMDRVLRSVVFGRAGYITRSYWKGAFDTQERIIRAFPNLFTIRAA